MKDYKKYKWFYTYSGKLVVGGKSAEQNDELLKTFKKTSKDYYVMHTSHPGSPFCIIVSEMNKVTRQDIEESAIFTGCFSRAWKESKKETDIHIFKLNQLSKEKIMKTGTWHVNGKVEKMNVNLKLALVKQKDVYRAIPVINTKKKDILLKVCPGKIDKEKMADEIMKILRETKEKKNELLASLPAGGVRIC